MGKVAAGFSMSLDGFITGPDEDVSRIFAWMYAGNTEVNVSSGGTDYEFKLSQESVDQMEERTQAVGAIVSGRRMFDIAQGWGGRHPMDVPVFVVTHRPALEWEGKGAPFTFVTDGLASAVRQAQAAAGDRMIGVGGASLMRQCIKAGLLDTIGVDLVPVLLGQGVRMFEYMGIEPVELTLTRIAQGTGVTHLSFDIVK